MDELGNRSLPEAYEANISYVQSQVETLGKDTMEGLGKLRSNSSQFVNDLSDVVVGEDLANITSTAGDVAVRYLESKIQSLKEALITTTPVEVRALIKEVSPYVQSPAEAGNALKSKLTDMVSQLGPGGSFWKNLGEDFLSFASGDAAVQSTLANLNSVKLFADGLNMVSDAIDTAKRIFNTVEPYIPLVEVVADLFSAGRTQNAADGQKAGMEIIENAETVAQKLPTLYLGSFRRYIYSLKIPIPNLLLGAINTLSVRDAITKDWSNGWLGAVFDEDFYDQTVYSYTWETSWNKTIRDTLGSMENALNNWENLNFTDFNGNPITRGEFMKSKFMTTFTQNFMRQAVATARKEARIRAYGASDWVNDYSDDSKYSGDRGIGDGSKEKMNLLSFQQSLSASNAFGLSPFNTTSSIRSLSGQILERYI